MRSTTRRTLIAGVAAMSMLLAACGAEVDDDADDAAAGTDTDAGSEDEDADADADAELELEDAGDGPTIAYVSFTQDITEMAGQNIRGMESRLEEAGFDYALTTAAPAGGEDHQGMDRILEDVATLAPDYAVISPSSYELVDDRIQEIEAAGTTTVVVDFNPDTLEEEPGADPLTWIAVDHYNMGYNGAAHLAEEQFCPAGEDITVVPFWGPAASEISQDRVGGAFDALDDVLGDCGVEYEIVDEVFADFDRTMAFNFAESIATAQPDLDLIIGANSNTALGVMESYISQDMIDDITILGMGGQLDELAAICRGDIEAAGFRDPIQMGYDIADAIMNDWNDEGDVPRVTMPGIPVTYDCESVFDIAPMEMLDLDGFRGNISEEMWNEHTS